jgi:DNA-binding IclR family transcriptional regulator
LKTVRKALAILDSFNKDSQIQGVTEIANRFGFNKSTTHIILKTLTEENYLIFDLKTKKYSLGFKPLELAGRIAYGRDLRDIALPIMQKLSETVEEDITLNILVEGHRVCIAIAESRSFVRHIIPVGKALPLHCSAAGKVLLAYMDPEDAESIIKKSGLPKYTSKTITDKKTLFAQLDLLRKNGVGESRNEYGKDAAALAFPIFNGKNELVAALSIQTTITRLTKEAKKRYESEGKRAANSISRYLPEVLS